MSNRLFQGLVHQMRDTIDATVGVVDDTATIIACSDLTKVGTTNEFVSLDLSDVHDIFIRDGYTYKPFGSRAKPEYAVFVEGMDDTAAKYANILAISLFNIKQYYDEKYDRNNFIKNVVLDNVLPGDIVIKARELHFNSEVSRVVLLVRIVSANDVSAYDVIQNLFPDKNKDFVFTISESDIVLVKEIKGAVDTKDLACPFHCRYFEQRVLHPRERGYRYYCDRCQGTVPFVQGSTDGSGSRQGIRYRQGDCQL